MPVMASDSKAHQWGVCGEDQTVLQNPGIVLATREKPSQKLTVASIHYDFEASVVLLDFHAQKSQATLQHNVRLMSKSWDFFKNKSFLDSFIFFDVQGFPFPSFCLRIWTLETLI